MRLKTPILFQSHLNFKLNIINSENNLIKNHEKKL